MTEKLFMSLGQNRSLLRPDSISQLFTDLNNRANNIIDGVNEVNDSVLSIVDEFASDVGKLRSGIAEAADISLAINTSSGNSNTQFKISESDIYSSDNVIYKDDKISLGMSMKDKYLITDIDVMSNGSNGNSADFDIVRFFNKESITTSTRFEVERFNSTLSASLNIDIGEPRVLNMVQFSMADFGINAPQFGDVEISSDGISYYRIEISQYANKNICTINFRETVARFIRLSVSQDDGYVALNGKKRFAIGISNLSVGVGTSSSSGTIVFGPFKANNEILKASINGNLPNDGSSIDNIKLEISHNLSLWSQVSVPYSITDVAKIVNFNTIAKDAITTDSPVRSLYLKVSIDAVKVEKRFVYGNKFNKTSQQISGSNNVIRSQHPISENNLLVGVAYDDGYGKRRSFNNLNILDGAIDRTTLVKQSGEEIVKKIGLNELIGGVDVHYEYKKCNVVRDGEYIIDAGVGYDISSAKFYKFTNPIKSTTSVRDAVAKCVISFRNVAGIYKIVSGKHSSLVDLSSGYFSSAYQYIYKSDDAILFDPIGIEVCKLKSKNGFINLLDYFTIEEPKSNQESPVNAEFNRGYPSVPLGNNQFAIVDYKIISSAFTALIDCETVIATEIEVDYGFGVNNKIIAKSLNTRLVRMSEDLMQYDGLNIAKLNKSSILKGSVKFDYDKASVFSFIEEVEYINGKDEFSKGKLVERQIPKGVSRFTLQENIGNTGNIIFVGAVDVFQNRVYSESELVEKGDYLLQDIKIDEDMYTVVILPNGVKTHDIIATKYITDTKQKNTSTGYYSIDYMNGILYSQTVIDGNTSISYIYSNIYMEGTALQQLKSNQYTSNTNSVTINDGSINGVVSIISKSGEESILNINTSPTIGGLIINTVSI